MSSVLVGIFSPGKSADSSAVRRALGADPSGELASGPLSVAWSAGSAVAAPLTVVLTGSVRNLHAIAGQLGAEPGIAPERLLAIAFERWGDGALTRLRGNFVVAVWNETAKKGLVAVDQLGAASLFLHESNGGFAFASEIRNLVRLLDRAPGPDSAAVVQWLVAGSLQRGQTLLEGVKRLEGGQLVRLDDRGWELARYWSPSYSPPLQLEQEELAGSLRIHLERAVGERLARSGRTGVLLSGGLDSSTVAAFANRAQGPGGVSAYSFVFPEHAEVDESALIDELVSTIGIDSDRTPVRVSSSLRSALEFQRAWELPAASPTLFFNLPLLRRAATEGVSVMLDGEGGDELLGCSPYLIADYLRGGHVYRAARLARRLPGVGRTPSRRLLWSLTRRYGIRGAAPYSFHSLARTLRGPSRYAPNWLRAESAKLYVDVRGEWDWKRRSGPRWWAFLSDLLITWRELGGVHDFLRRRAQLAGLESRHPLLDDLDLIEFVLRLPPDLAYDPELNRPFARAALEGIVPDAIRLRAEKSDFSPLLVDSMSEHDHAIVAELLTCPQAETAAYARPDRIHQLVNVPSERRNIAWAWQVWRLATTECWLRSQSDSGFAGRVLEQMTDEPAGPRDGRLSSGAVRPRAARREQIS